MKWDVKKIWVVMINHNNLAMPKYQKVLRRGDIWKQGVKIVSFFMDVEFFLCK